MSILDMSLAPASLTEIAQFAGISTLLQPEVQHAMEQGSDIIIAASRANMNWKNPSGDLESSMRRMSETPYEIVAGSDLPYARRREQGFDGADSLGRVYHDVGAFFLSSAMEDNEQQVLTLIENAVNKTLGVA
jgi:hypothetical protein